MFCVVILVAAEAVQVVAVMVSEHQYTQLNNMKMLWKRNRTYFSIHFRDKPAGIFASVLIPPQHHIQGDGMHQDQY